jgi:tetratricopeptide (TPR) repeat protein
MKRFAMIALMVAIALSLDARQVFGQRADQSKSELNASLEGLGSQGGFDQRGIEEALSSDRFADRQSAMRFIGQNQVTTSNAVRKAAESPNPEVAGRAKWILQAWQRGSLLGADDGFLSPSVTGSRLGLLLDRGRFDAILFVLEITQDGQRSVEVRKEIASLISLRFASCVRAAMESQQLPKFVEIIGLIADSREMALCRLQLLQLLGVDLETTALLPESAKGWTAQQRDETMVLLLCQLGKIDDAIAQAEKLTDRHLLPFCLILASRWNELADDAMTVVKDSEVGSEASVLAWSRILVAAERSGVKELQREAIENLSTVAFDESDDVRGIRWKSLAVHGQLDAAFAILDQYKPHFSAGVALVSSRPARAFDVLGYPLDLVDTKYDEWVDQALEAQTKLQESQRVTTSQICPEVDRIVLLVRCLDSIGRDDVAFSIAERLCQKQVLVLTGDVKSYLLRRLSPMTRNEWIEELLLVGKPSQLQANERYLLADALGDCDAAMLSLLMETVKKLKGSATFSEQLSLVCQIVRGQTGHDLNVDVVLEALVANIFTRLDGLQPATKKMAAFSVNIHEMLLRAGNHELAFSYLRKFADSGEVDAILRLGDAELFTGSMDKAKGWFAKLEHLSATTMTTGDYRQLGNLRELDVATVKALVGRWVIAKRIGDRELTSKLKKQLDAVLCSPSPRFRLAIADYLREHGESTFAMQIYRGLLPIAGLTPESQGNTYVSASLYDVVRKYVVTIQEDQPAEAARLFDIAIIGMIDSNRYRVSAYVTLPLLIQEWRLDAAIREKDRVKVVHCLDRILELDPLDISFSEERLPEIRDAGMAELADSVLDQIMDEGVRYAKRFSFDAMTCNNVAWVAAKNERRLEDALALATLAVQTEPESTTYRDTLAEVLFLLGRCEEALQIEQACLLDDPGQWHLHEQIEKYTKAAARNKP